MGEIDCIINPLLSDYDVKEAKKAMSRAMFAQEYECEWTTTEDQVYESLNEEKHIGEFIGERFTEVIAGLDVGYRDENVFVVIGTNGKQYWIIDEFVSKESTTNRISIIQ